jgi:peptide/nickel transport system ATP-binding protein
MSRFPLIELRAVSKRFVAASDLGRRMAERLGLVAPASVVQAVDNVSFAIGKGEVLGLVGESGCGKSTLGRMVADLMKPSEGSILYRGEARRDDLRARLAVQMVFQDPFASLNPRMRVGPVLGEAPLAHGLIKRNEFDDFVNDLLRRVGLDPSYKRRYPHQFSGGQRQRIGIARAISVNPEFIVCDEPVAALDVSIQAQILNLFIAMRQELGLSYLFISHDISVIRHVADRVLVMYLGRIVESASTEELFARPNHPYTRGLLLEAPQIDRRHTTFMPIKGEMPSPLNPPSGCHFHPRCPFAFDRCKVEAPALKEIGLGRLSACHLNDPIRCAA